MPTTKDRYMTLQTRLSQKAIVVYNSSYIMRTLKRLTSLDFITSFELNGSDEVIKSFNDSFIH
jgi:hypothetical protein